MWKFRAKATEKDLEDALKSIQTESGQDIVSANLVSSITLNGDDAICLLLAEANQIAEMEKIRSAAETKLLSIKGIKTAHVILTAEKPSNAEAAAPVTATGGLKPPPPENPNAKKPPSPPLPRPDIGKIIAVSSGKGGVGKSTIAFNLAYALSQQGHKVGLLDADIYGPSAPRLTGQLDINYAGRKPDTNKAGKIIPPEAHGLKVMSIGFLIDEENPLIWRGPMVQSAIVQLFRDVEWDGLDYLIIDMPPGTGDAQLTLAQKMPPDGAIIVSTPQDLALIDARKGLEMYKKTNVPVLGIIENMSVFTCPKCGEDTPIFGHDGAKEQAEKLGIPFLGAIPLALEIREQADNGTPSQEATFSAIAKKLSQIKQSNNE